MRHVLCRMVYITSLSYTVAINTADTVMLCHGSNGVVVVLLLSDGWMDDV